jgi:hypothetical protein
LEAYQSAFLIEEVFLYTNSHKLLKRYKISYKKNLNHFSEVFFVILSWFLCAWFGVLPWIQEFLCHLVCFHENIWEKFISLKRMSFIYLVNQWIIGCPSAHFSAGKSWFLAHYETCFEKVAYLKDFPPKILNIQVLLSFFNGKCSEFWWVLIFSKLKSCHAPFFD